MDRMTPEWRVPGKPVRVRFGARLPSQLVNASAAASPRSGGLLIGRLINGEVDRVLINACMPLLWDRSRNGAPYLTEEQEEQAKAALLALKEGDGRGQTVVGWYRSADAHETIATADDIHFFNRHFHHRSDLCILAGDTASGPCARVFVRGTHIRPGGIAHLALPLFPIDTGPGRAAAKFEDRRRAWLRAMVAVLCVGLLTLLGRRFGTEATLSASHLASPAPDELTVVASVTPDSPLSLAAAPSEKGISLHWTLTNPALNTPRCAVLEIVDASDRRKTRLSPAQIRKGEFLYANAGGMVHFRLGILTAEGRLVSGQLRLTDSSKPVQYAPLAAQFASVMDTLGESLERGAQEGLCAQPSVPIAGKTPRLIAAANILDGATFTLDDSHLQGGEVLVIRHELLLNERGQTVDVRTPDSMSYAGISASLARQARAWRFSAAQLDGTPVASVVTFTFTVRSGTPTQ